MNKLSIFLVCTSFVVACNTTPPAREITSESLLSYIEVLASDEFEGRAPSTIGETRTMEYLETEFKKAGAVPGNGNSWLQEVPLLAIDHTSQPVFTVKSVNGDSVEFIYGENLMLWSKKNEPQQEINDEEMVFVGYGINAPEFGWNDYEGVDVKGKVVVIMVNDPGYATQDASVFNGNAMTYYGRWTYKFEEAARQGAAAAIIVHETGAAGYPWEVVSGSWSGTQFGLDNEGSLVPLCSMEGWITSKAAQQLFSTAGVNYDSLSQKAAQKGFEAVTLELKATARVTVETKKSVSHNFIAKIEGSEFPDEYIIYSAHWDHLGKDSTLEGDQIYNGAVDNATGTAALIELAAKYAEHKPMRSVLFVAVTAEEQGLLGSAYYASSPVYPLENTVAVINMDAMNVLGEMNDVVIIGFGNSELDDYVKKYAEKQNREVVAEPNPEKGYFYRSDHFSFAKAGVPALYIESGQEHRKKGKEWAIRETQYYETNRYHKPADEVLPEWDLSGMILDLKLMYVIGSDLANSRDWPNWRDGVAFKAKRDEQRP